ncbi:MAG: hypothetical protein QM739_17770 [Propionivibrio sp.]
MYRYLEWQSLLSARIDFAARIPNIAPQLKPFLGRHAPFRPALVLCAGLRPRLPLFLLSPRLLAPRISLLFAKPPNISCRGVGHRQNKGEHDRGGDTFKENA